MTSYARVEDKAVVELTSALPVSTSRTSNFYLLPEEERNKQGWYTVVEVAEEIPGGYEARVSVAFDGKSVTRTTSAFKPADYEERATRLLRERTSSSILSKVPLYEQINAVLGIYDEDKCAAIKVTIEKELEAYRLAKAALEE